MTDDDKKKYKNLFVDTARDYIKEIDDNISLLRKDPNDENVIKKMHIAAHSVKAQCFMIGYPSLGYFCAAVEKIMREKQEGKLQINTNMLDSVERGVIKARSSLMQIEESDKESDLSDEIKLLEKFIKENK